MFHFSQYACLFVYHKLNVWIEQNIFCERPAHLDTAHSIAQYFPFTPKLFNLIEMNLTIFYVINLIKIVKFTCECR